MKKTLSLFLVLLMVMMGLLAGCSGGGSDSASGTGGSGGTDGGSDGSSAEGKIQLDFWSFWGSDQRRPVIQHMVDAFNKSQDKIHVKYTYLPWGDVWTKELAAVAAGNPPDAIIQDIMSV
ncbi:MAG TPA: ABC transporter substrate-binding protein, partial [Bacillales bacterium]|nr:ABC transporter substrate-binding protein [Bacillales bacterium]